MNGMPLDDIFIFLKKYWWVGLVAFFITIMITGQKKAQQIIDLQQTAYQEEKKLLQESHRKEIAEINERLTKFEKDKADLQEQHEKLREELKKKKTQIVKKYIVLWESDFPELEKELEDLFDIEKYTGS